MMRTGNATKANAMHNAQQIINWFGKHGDVKITPESMAAILGNMWGESGLDPHNYESGYSWGADRGYGLTQWTPRSKLEKHAKHIGGDFKDWRVQLEAFKREMSPNKYNHPYVQQGYLQWLMGRSEHFGYGTKYKHSFHDFLSNKMGFNLADLTKMFTIMYEAPARQHIEGSFNKRYGFAKEAYDKLDFSPLGGSNNKKPKFKYLMIAGHGKQPNGGYDTGATGGFPQGEHKLFSETLFPEMKKHCDGRCIWITEQDVYAHGSLVDLVNEHGGKDKVKVFEWHYDSAGGACGGHVIKRYVGDATELDKKLVEVIDKHFGILPNHKANNGISPRNNLANVLRAKRAGIDYRLVELFDGSCPNNVETMKNNVSQIAKDLMDILDMEDSSGYETPNPPSTVPGKEEQGIDDGLLDIFNQFIERLEDALSTDIYNNGSSYQNHNSWLIITRQMDNMWKVRPNIQFLNYLKDFFQRLGGILDLSPNLPELPSPGGDSGSEPAPPPPSNDSGGDVPDNIDGVVFPIDYKRYSGNNVNWWVRDAHPRGSLPFNMGFGTPRATGPHKGYDIGARAKTPINNVKAGKVIWRGWFDSGGNTVRIKFDEPITVNGRKAIIVQYLHLTSFNVSQGQHVKTGQVVGTVGSTGGHMAPHLHIEFWTGNQYSQSLNGFINPELILRVDGDKSTKLPVVSDL